MSLERLSRFKITLLCNEHSPQSDNNNNNNEKEEENNNNEKDNNNNEKEEKEEDEEDESDYVTVVSATSTNNALQSVLVGEPFVTYLHNKFNNLMQCSVIIDPDNNTIINGLDLIQKYTTLPEVIIRMDLSGELFLNIDNDPYSHLYEHLGYPNIRRHFTSYQLAILEVFAYKYKKYYNLFRQLIDSQLQNLNMSEWQKIIQYEMRYGSIVIEEID